MQVTKCDPAAASVQVRACMHDLKREAKACKAEEAEESQALNATKKGSAVMVTVRKVCNKNVTFVDYLESWGYDKDKMKALAKEWRKRFSVSASVAERSGTEGSDSKFWSVQLQGKYAEQVASSLRDFGVKNVSIHAKKGILTKKDKSANV